MKGDINLLHLSLYICTLMTFSLRKFKYGYLVTVSSGGKKKKVHYVLVNGVVHQTEKKTQNVTISEETEFFFFTNSSKISIFHKLTIDIEKGTKSQAETKTYLFFGH